MARIQSSTGLITGIPIEDTVNKLLAVEGQPRDLLIARTKTLSSEQLAINNLSSLMLAFQFEANKFSATSNLFQTKSVTSSDPDTLQAVLTDGGKPAVGQYAFRACKRPRRNSSSATAFKVWTT